MTYARHNHIDDSRTLPRMPHWVTSARPQVSEDVAFLSGAALSHLHLVLGSENLPKDLLRARLALRAAEACSNQAGRPERTGELRDALAFVQPGDLPGPAGETYRSWQRAVERPISIKALHRAMPRIEAGCIAEWVDAGRGAPVRRAVSVLETVLSDAPREDTAALILADAALAQGLGWDYMVPLLAAGLKRGDPRKSGEELQLACHRAVIASAIEAARLARDLAHRAAHLMVVAPKLRAKGAGEAVGVFLTRDAVAPTSLTSLNSARAARRFCDRLVELGAVRELTGRDTFRLYGV